MLRIACVMCMIVLFFCCARVNGQSSVRTNPAAGSLGSLQEQQSPQIHASGSEYAIQVGAFKIRKNAERLHKQLADSGYDAQILENLIDGKNLFYLVWVGTFKSPEDAIPQLVSLKTKYKIYGVLRKRSSWKR